MLKPYNNIGRKKMFKKNLLLDIFILEMGPISCPETSVKNYHSVLIISPRISDLFFVFEFDFRSETHREGRQLGAQIQNSIDMEQLKHA
jgi:hypothetical protein